MERRRSRPDDGFVDELAGRRETRIAETSDDETVVVITVRSEETEQALDTPLVFNFTLD